MIKSATVLFACAVLVCMIPAAGHAQLAMYSQDFESLNQAEETALSADGWFYFANVFASDGTTYLYGYGPGPAPNGTGAFSNVAVGEGGAAQGAQQLVVFSDYNNGDHGVGNIIESNVFQEQVVGASDVGDTWVFTFDAKMGDLVAPSTALAFIKTLDPNAGFALTNFVTVDMTSIPSTWSEYSMSIAIDASLEGQILQFGFLNTATNYDASGVFYDNVSFAPDGTIAVDETTWGSVKGNFGQ